MQSSHKQQYRCDAHYSEIDDGRLDYIGGYRWARHQPSMPSNLCVSIPALTNEFVASNVLTELFCVPQAVTSGESIQRVFGNQFSFFPSLLLSPPLFSPHFLSFSSVYHPPISLVCRFCLGGIPLPAFIHSFMPSLRPSIVWSSSGVSLSSLPSLRPSPLMTHSSFLRSFLSRGNNSFPAHPHPSLLHSHNGEFIRKWQIIHTLVT